MISLIRCFIFLAFSLTATVLNADPGMKKWEVFELSLTASKNYTNPYQSIPVSGNHALVKVEFHGLTGAAKGKSIVVVGFWYGGRQWKVRFAPPEAGWWEYKSVSEDSGLNNKRGKLEVTEWSEAEKQNHPSARGFIQVMKTGVQAGRFFQYTDGTPFLWIGDTWWNWTNRKITFSSYKSLVDDRASKGFNIGQLFVAANGCGSESSLLDETYTILDVDHMKKVDSMIAYANHKGITVWVHGWWSRENLGKTAGEEKIKRWWRYLVHRLGAYNVIWVVAGEYNMDNNGNLGLSFWKDLGKFIRDEDPYDRIVGIHNTPPGWEGGADAPQWSTAEVLHNEEWLDYNQSQVGHGRWRNEMIPDIVAKAYAQTPPKPIVVTEPWYEFVEGNPSARDIRFGAWTAILSGAAGHTYGGGHVWLAHTPDSPMGGGPWPLEKDFSKNTLNYSGAVSMSHLAGFFKNIEWWKLSPHAELLYEYPDRYCLANPGQEYVVYLRWGGRVKIDLSTASETDTFEYYWFDPGNGKHFDTKTVLGGAVRGFAAPEEYPAVTDFKDWVLHIRKKT